MKIKYFCLIFFTLVISKINAQADYLIINENIRLPKDSIERKRLVNNLNVFLYSVKDNGSYENWILPEEKIETQILITEIQDFTLNDTINFKPYLINFELLDDKKTYSIQIAYISLLNNSQPLLKAIFEFIAHKNNDKFLFSSPLSANTKEWKIRRFEHLIFESALKTPFFQIAEK